MSSVRDVQSYLEDRLPEHLELLRQMVSINSFTANAQGVNKLGELTRELFVSLGFEAESVASNNPLYGNHLFLHRSARPFRDQRDRPTVALISHLDTVYPPEEEQSNDFVWRVEGDRLYGPGAVDIKGGTVMILLVLGALHHFNRELYDSTNWLVCLNASEEVLALDFGERCLERLPNNTRACLVFESGTPSDEGYRIVTARKGKASFRITTTGRSAHSGNAHQHGANAIWQMAHAIQKIQSYTDYSHQITYNVGLVSGGFVINRVPSQAEARTELRAFSPQVFEQGLQKMLELDGSSDVTSQDGYPCRVRVELDDRTEPWPSNPTTDQLFDIWQQAASETGLVVIPEKRGGLSDGNMLWDHFPTLDGLGPVGANAHCAERSPDGSKDQEFALASSFISKGLINVMAIMKLLDEPGDRE